jgi:lysophospholipase L1-like esterase
MKIIFIISLTLNLIFFAGVVLAIRRVGGINNLFVKLFSGRTSGPDERRFELFSVMGSVKNKIVFLGDSITEFCDWAELLDNKDVVNRGIPGDVTSGVLSRLTGLENEKPDKIFLMIGINDLMNGVPGKQVLNNYEEILKRLKKAGIEGVYPQSILPVNNLIPYHKIVSDDLIQEVNAGIKELSQKYGYHYVDLYPLFIDQSGNLGNELTTDGLHLSGKGYLIWKSSITGLL